MRLRAFLQAIRAPHQHSNIELGPRPPRLTPNKPQRPYKKFPIGVLQRDHQYSHPQELNEDDEDPEFLSEMTESSETNSLSSSGGRKDKGISLYIIFLLSLYLIIGFAPICGMGYYMLTFREASMKKKQDPETLWFLTANLNADPIMDIQILERRSTCPAGYERLKLGSWPGTVAGCLCDNGDLYGTSCDQLGSEKCKKDIPSTPPIDLYEWNKSIWCLKRAVFGTDYVRKAKCPFPFKECYTGGCFKGACPITKVEIDSTGNTTKRVVFSNTKGELPIVNVQITLGDMPCFTQDLFAQSIKNSSYELSAIKQDKCDKYGLNDQFSSRIDSQTAYGSFMQNSFPSPVLHLPHFQENAKTTTAILSSMTRIKVAAKHDRCLDINEKALNKFIETWQKDTFWIFLVLSVDLIFRIVPLYQILRSLSSGHKAKGSEGSEDSLCHYLNLLSFIPTFIAVILFYSLHPQVVVLKKYFGEYNSLKCYAGSQGSMVISDYLAIGESIEASFWVEQVILFSSICSAFVSFMLKSGKI